MGVYNRVTKGGEVHKRLEMQRQEGIAFKQLQLE